MFWKKQWKKLQNKDGSEEYEIPAYSKDGGHIKSLERQGGLTTSATYGGMGVRELQLRMELIVEPILSKQNSVFEPAKELAVFSKVDQDRFLQSVEKISKTDTALAFKFCHFGPLSLQLVDEENWNDWTSEILTVYNKEGLDSAINTIKDVNHYIESYTHAPSNVALNEVSRILESFIIGLSGRQLSIEASESFYTDTESVRLPENVSQFDRQEDNFALYKAMAVHQWAQTWFGTWRMNIDAMAKTYQDPDRALKLFHKLETIRLDACIKRELPGIAKTVKNLFGELDTTKLSKKWQFAIEKMRESDTTVRDTFFLLETIYKENDSPEDRPYQGELRPRETWKTIQERTDKERELFKAKLAELKNDLQQKSSEASMSNDSDENDDGFSIDVNENDSMSEGYNIELRFDDEAVEPPEELQELLESILQDLGEIPDDYLLPSTYQTDDIEDENDDQNLSPSLDNEENVYIYDEWDHSRQKYRKEWCYLKELEIKPVYDNFANSTIHKHRNLLKHLRRTFEALREDDKRLKRQPYGDDIDLDAVIESYTDIKIGLEASQNLFTKSRKIDRNIAVMFMIDMSGSTAGWINEMEREALVLLCESLQLLGDRYAIYGFSGITHERCELYVIKEFDEGYDDQVKARISGIQPQDYTRMGAAIRHLTKKLHQVEARTKLLITLSDGRPDDKDGYRGPYGIEDTRRALIEAKFLGIHPFCITIDEEAMDYLQHMYGAVNFAVIDHVDKLPYKVSDIYRRITV